MTSDSGGWRDWGASRPPFVKEDGYWYFVGRGGYDIGPFDAEWKANIIRGQYYLPPPPKAPTPEFRRAALTELARVGEEIEQE